jgi:hypothetical protein
VICQSCGVEAPTKHVVFYQNIGALVMRFYGQIEGNLCKSCIHKHFWKMTLINLFLGWWGVISLIVTPFFLLNNIFRYLFCLGMDPVPPGAGPPELTEEAAQRISTYAEPMIQRINAGEPVRDVVEDVARRVKVTPGQVILYLRALA